MDYFQLKQQIQKVQTLDFEQIAIAVFRYQAQYNTLYREFINYLGLVPDKITTIQQIPYLPISMFKQHQIQTGTWAAEKTFTSSGTTGQSTSQHLVKDTSWYLQNTVANFEHFYANPHQYCILALLPSYLERQGSSLVLMAEHFIQTSQYPQSGFFLYNTQELALVLGDCIKNNVPTILLGVTYALLDFAENYPISLTDNILVMETGGMKGRRAELPKRAMQAILQEKFSVPHIHSEYGMTELFSQAYSKGQGLFEPSPTMRILMRDATDPLSYVPNGRTGAINIIDLANIDTLSFIATDDLGKLYDNQSFEVLGRLDASDIRGCNLMI